MNQFQGIALALLVPAALSLDFIKRGVDGMVKKEMWIYCTWREYDRINKRGVGTAEIFDMGIEGPSFPEKIIYGHEAVHWGVKYFLAGIFTVSTCGYVIYKILQ